jgi:hypothetical protein
MTALQQFHLDQSVSTAGGLASANGAAARAMQSVLQPIVSKKSAHHPGHQLATSSLQMKALLQRCPKNPCQGGDPN